MGIEHVIASNGSKWPETLQELHSTIEHYLAQNSEVDAFELTLAICDCIGGIQLYIPRATGLKRHIRNNKIYFDLKSGMHLQDVAKKYKLAVQTIYNIRKNISKELKG